jgi:hypothetical protein
MDPSEIDRRLATTRFRTREGVIRYATHTLEYFSSLCEREPEYKHWQRGRRIAERWIRMLPGDAPTQQALDAILAEMRTDPQPGSGYCDLYRRIQDWAAAFDLRVSDDYDFPSHW